MRMVRTRRAPLGLAILGAAALLGSRCHSSLSWVSQSRHPASTPSRVTVRAAATSTDTFDPWTVLGVPTDTPVEDARKAYRKLIASVHPDLDPSPEAAEKFQKYVRAIAIVTGEDRDLDANTLLKNAVNNLRNDIEFKEQQIKKMNEQAAAEAAKVEAMKEQLNQAEQQRTQVTQELSAYGGGTLGLFVAGPMGAMLGAAVGLAIKDREDALGQVVRGVGTITKGVVDVVGRSIGK